MKRGVSKAFRLFLFVCWLCLTLSMGQALLAGENEDFRFATKLQQDGMFVAAAEEFLRFADRYPRSLFRDEALIQAGEAYMQAGKAQSALEVFERFLVSYPADEKVCKAGFYRGRIFKALGRYREAAVEYLAVADERGECALADDALLEGGESLLSAGEAEEAAAVFRRLINRGDQSEHVPRAKYGLALALSSMGRDLGAVQVLEEIVARHPSSPVAALSLVKLGERALGRGEIDRARELFEQVIDRYKERSLQEIGMMKLIEIYAQRGEDGALFEASKRYIDRFPDAKNRGEVFARGIDAGRRLGRYEEALGMADAGLADSTVQDSNGELALLRGRLLGEVGRAEEALGALAAFRRDHLASPLFGEALVLEADLRAGSGAHREAARLYHLALLETEDVGARSSILARLAKLSLEGLEDTLSAIRCWETIVEEDPSGENAEEALWRSSALRESLGDARIAREGYTVLLERFPDGNLAAEARRRIDLLDSAPRWGEEPCRGLVAAAASGESQAARLVRAAVILVDRAGEAAEAVPLLERAIGMELPDSLVAQARYYLGKAYLGRSGQSVQAGLGAAEDRNRGLSTWWSVARDYTGTAWAMRSHRDYLEHRMSELESRSRLTSLDNFAKIYGGAEEARWVAAAKIDVLYEMALGGEAWAADSALALCADYLKGAQGAGERGEVLLKRGYLLRMKGDLEGASRAFEEFVSGAGGDARSAAVLYDLGETLLGLKRYDAAAAAYSRCLERRPARALAEKCSLRIADCLYSQYRFADAARAYADFAGGNPRPALADEAAYRQSLALERMGLFERVDSILASLAERRGIEADLRARVLRKRVQHLLDAGRSDEAKPLIEALVSIDRSPRNLELLGGVFFASGEFGSSIEAYSNALKLADADTCALLAARARARYHDDDFKRAGEDLALLLGRCPDHAAIPDVYLERGIVEVERGRCAEAEATLGGVRERHPAAEAAVRALYHLAVCDMKRGGFAEAAEKLARVVQQAPQSPIIDRVYFKLASAHVGAGNLNLAAANYTLAAEATKDDDLRFQAVKNLGGTYQELEQWDRAAEVWRSVTERYPEGEGIVEIFFNLGFCYSQAGRHEMAYEVYSRIPGIAENEEQEGRSHYWAGISLKYLERPAEAVREFLRVPYLRTGGMWGVTAKLEAAACYEELGELDQAETIYRDVISAHGEGSDWGKVAVESLGRLRAARGEKGPDGSGEGK